MLFVCYLMTFGQEDCWLFFLSCTALFCDSSLLFQYKRLLHIKTAKHTYPHLNFFCGQWTCQLEHRSPVTQKPPSSVNCASSIMFSAHESIFPPGRLPLLFLGQTREHSFEHWCKYHSFYDQILHAHTVITEED